MSSASAAERGTTRRLALLLGAALVSAACGGGGDKGVITVATSFPVTGADRASGRPAEAAVAYAIQKTPTIKGFTIRLKPYDDTVSGLHDAQQGARNYRGICGDESVLGAVGPLTSDVARAIIPVASGCGLVTISPATSDECLTRPLDSCDPKPSALRGTDANTFFRIAAPDTLQGSAMADFAYDTLRATRVAIWSDGETLGKGMADAFRAEFERKGGSVVIRQDFDWKSTTDFRAFLQRAADGGAQAIYAGATSGTKACVPRGQSKGILDPAAVAYLGPDGIGDGQCIADAGGQARNMYVTKVPDPALDPANKPLLDDLRKTMTGADDYGAYTFAAYDSARILLDAIGRAIDAAGGRMPTRRQVLDAVQATKALNLSTGTYSFDRYGDPTSSIVAVYELRSGDWAPRSRLTFTR